MKKLTNFLSWLRTLPLTLEPDLYSVCRLYLLAQLNKQGLGIRALDSVFNAIVLNQILYALPVYFGYLTEGHKDMLRRVLKRANRMGFTYYRHDFETSQYRLFLRSWSQLHCLHHLFTVKSRPPGAMHLRQRGHDSVLPNIRYEFNKRHFIARSLFNYV